MIADVHGYPNNPRDELNGAAFYESRPQRSRTLMFPMAALEGFIRGARGLSRASKPKTHSFR